MPAFHYKAVNTQGKTVSGVTEADTLKQARQRLRTQGLLTERIEEIKEKTSRFSRQKISHEALILFTRQLATLLDASVPLAEALYSVMQQAEKNSVREVLAALHAKVTEGYTFAKSLAQFPQLFSTLYCSTVQTGEASGQLSQVLLELADYLETQDALRQRLQQALIYPLLMLVVSFAIVFFLLAYVVPQLMVLFEEQNTTLPLVTRILLNISAGLEQFGLWLLASVALLIVFVRRMYQKENIRIKIDVFLLKIPAIGRWICLLETARFSRTLAILLSAGVPMLDALKTSAQIVNNRMIRMALIQVEETVRQGNALSQALQSATFFPPLSLQLIKSGESAGRLNAMLQRVAQLQSQMVERVVQQAVKIFEPLLTVVMGAVVLFIVLAVLLPIFGLSSGAV